jgi:hypothetical protein
MSDDLVQYDNSKVPAPYGQNNTGVICHFNSLLQGLAGCSAFVEAVLANRPYMGRTGTGRALYDYVCAAVPLAAKKALRFGQEFGVQQSSAIVLSALCVDLRYRRPQVNFGNSQESASEGLVLLLDMLDDPDPKQVDTMEAPGDEPGTKKKVPIYEENPVSRLFYHRYEIENFCGTCMKSVSRSEDISVQFNLFYYDTLKRKPTTPASYGDTLRSHVSQLEDYHCEKCKVKGKGYRLYRLVMIGEIVVVVYNQYYTYTRQARYFPGMFPLPGFNKTQLLYKQVAQVEQYGGRDSGHYMARGLRNDGKVYNFDDTRVSASRFGPSSGVYMVFYHYVENVVPSVAPSNTTSPMPKGG